LALHSSVTEKKEKRKTRRRRKRRRSSRRRRRRRRGRRRRRRRRRTWHRGNKHRRPCIHHANNEGKVLHCLLLPERLCAHTHVQRGREGSHKDVFLLFF